MAAQDKAGVIDELAARAAAGTGRPRSHIKEILLERESLGSTGLGRGVALPHGKSGLLDRPFMLAARSQNGVDFDSPDGTLAYIFVMVLSSLKGDVQEHLQILARLGRFLHDPENVAALRNSPDADDFYRRLTRQIPKAAPGAASDC